MSWMWAGPYCSLQLAELGAEVIRIESNQRPCMNRRVPPYANDEPGLNRGGSFNQWNQAKKSVLLDMKQPEAVILARELIAGQKSRRELRRGVARGGLDYEDAFEDNRPLRSPSAAMA